MRFKPLAVGLLCAGAAGSANAQPAAPAEIKIGAPYAKHYGTTRHWDVPMRQSSIAPLARWKTGRLSNNSQVCSANNAFAIVQGQPVEATQKSPASRRCRFRGGGRQLDALIG
ncbi:MAG: hypothetical protein ABSC06_15625 [Rhodopila sp.]|jgi:hypothetical protein